MTALSLEPYLVNPESRPRLSAFDPDDIGPFMGDDGKQQAKALLKTQKERLAELQNLLYADGSQALLVVLQALDAGGKDSTIRKVMIGMNPQGVRVLSFRAPNQEELAHDFLWRVHRAVPAKGTIGVFNRSHYEDVLVARVERLTPEKVWKARYTHINQFEKLLSDAGTRVVKLYLHISPEEQEKRFRKRLENPDKHWKFNPDDLKHRARWQDYRKAFEAVFVRCSTSYAPWYIVPANHKWYRNVVVAQILIAQLEGMDLRYPDLSYDPSKVVIPEAR